MDEEAFTPTLTRTRTQTSPEGTGGNSEPCGGRSNPGSTTRSETQAQQEPGTKRANKDGDQSNAGKRSRFICMAGKLQRKGFEVPCPAEF